MFLRGRGKGQKYEQIVAALNRLTEVVDANATAARRDLVGVPKKGAECHKCRNHQRGSKLLEWTSVLATIAAFVSAGAVACQIPAVMRQADSAETVAQHEIRGRDFEFLARIRPAVSADGIEISNYSSVPSSAAAYWLLVRTSENEILEFEGALVGLGTCAKAQVPVSVLAESVTDGGGDHAPEIVGAARNLAYELHVAVQAPSGEWYLVGERGDARLIQGSEVEGQEQVRVPLEVPSSAYLGGEEALDALHSSELYQLAPDTYWEGADIVSAYVAEGILAVGEAVTWSNGDEGVVASSIDCR